MVQVPEVGGGPRGSSVQEAGREQLREQLQGAGREQLQRAGREQPPKMLRKARCASKITWPRVRTSEVH